MANHLLSQFSRDEQDDFGAVCTRHERSVDEFAVVDEDEYPNDGRVGAVTRRVTVTLRTEAVVGLYDGSHGNTWIADFENDLTARSFG